jgi:hypothetical protein
MICIKNILNNTIGQTYLKKSITTTLKIRVDYLFDVLLVYASLPSSSHVTLSHPWRRSAAVAETIPWSGDGTPHVREQLPVGEVSPASPVPLSLSIYSSNKYSIHSFFVVINFLFIFDNLSYSEYYFKYV